MREYTLQDGRKLEVHDKDETVVVISRLHDAKIEYNFEQVREFAKRFPGPGSTSTSAQVLELIEHGQTLIINTN